MKKITLILLMIILLLVTGCQEDEPEATSIPESPTATAVATIAEPTEAATAEPTEEITELETEANMLDLTALVEHPWQWIAFTNPAETFDIDMPPAYQLQFNNDSTVNIVADCNNASGSYTADGSSLTIEIGPMTMAACPPESRSDQFVAYLDSAANYFFEDGNLFIDLMADGGTMAFSPAPVPAQLPDDGESGAMGQLSDDIVAQLDAYLHSQIYTEGGSPELAAPGLVLYVETPNGRYLNAAGIADIEAETPMQVDDILEIGSNTKSMTMVLLMQLVEEGLISLDDPFSQYLPEQAAIVPNSDQITIRQLAQHIAGVHDYEEEIITNKISDPAAVEAGYTPAEIVQIAMDAGEPYFAPGEEGQWHYSNTGYILLGMIIESVTGESLGDLLQSRIFDPLSLESAVLIEGVPQAGEITTNGYYWTEEGERLDTTNWNGSQGWAAGAVSMTAEDLAIYGQALAAGEFFQDPDSLAEMLMFNPSAMDSGFPYGMGLIDFAGDGTVWGHEGATPGFQSLWYTDPEAGIMVVGLTNSGNYAAWSFLNVLNILNGDGAQPLSAVTLLPVGEFVPTTWGWTQFVTPAETMDIDETAGLKIDLAKDKSVTAYSNDCGLAFGAYTTSGLGEINFDIDPTSLTCDADALGAQFVQHLNDATTWLIANGQFIVELPADAGTMSFEYLPPQ